MILSAGLTDPARKGGMGVAQSIYIADDEPSIRRLVSVALRDEGYKTEEFSDGVTLLAALRHTLPDLVVLDWMMPEPDGLEVCRRLRADPATRPVPVLMLTARSDEGDRVAGLTVGADDYLSKPFSLRELAARAKALIRRKEYLSAQPRLLRAGGLTMNLDSRQADLEGRPLELTAQEFDLLSSLMRHSGQVLTREQLLDTPARPGRWMYTSGTCARSWSGRIRPGGISIPCGGWATALPRRKKTGIRRGTDG